MVERRIKLLAVMCAPPRILLLGGHGKISQLLTPMILSRSWHLTSVIRDPSQEATIRHLGDAHPGHLEVLISSLEDVKTEVQAASILSSTAPNYIIWSAGAGGTGGPERTNAIDRDSCISFIRAAATSPGVSKFILVSYIGSRAARAPWWSDADWQYAQSINTGALKYYHPAKLAADQCLTAVGRERGGNLIAICLRPGTLSDAPAGDSVSLGRTPAQGTIPRGDVACVILELLEKETKSRWLDLVEGTEKVKDAVERCLQDDVDCAEGEDMENVTS